jgi:antitoxin ParD1/3/4
LPANVHLTPELERFARDCVDAGRYDNISEVVGSGLRLLQESEARRQNFTAMLRAAEKEADRNGTIDLDTVLAELDGIIATQDR